MFRIYNLQELQRLRKLLAAFDNSTVHFPLDIFRDEAKVSAFPFGENEQEAYALSYDYGEVVFESAVGPGNRRLTARANEQNFEALCAEIVEILA